jgi:hypothetical protein
MAKFPTWLGEIFTEMKDFIIGVPIERQVADPRQEVDLSDTISQAETLLANLKAKNDQMSSQKAI